MQDLVDIGRDMVERLALQYEPVGVILYTDKDPLPPEMPFSDRELKSYCQALILAGEGQSFLLEREKMGCKLGTSVLGFEDDMEAFLDDGVLEKYGVGLFGTEEASAETILKSTYLAKGKTRAALIAPLSKLEETPQVVIFTADSEQVMWLLYALNYQKGGQMNLPQSGGALGGCADITAMPLLEGIPNVTFLGLGCRLKSAIGPNHLMLGINGKDLAMTHKHIKEMAKPIDMLNRQRAAS